MSPVPLCRSEFAVGSLMLLLLLTSCGNSGEREYEENTDNHLSALTDSVLSSTAMQMERSSLTQGEKGILEAIAARHPDFNYTENVLRYRESSGRNLFSEVIFERDSSGLYFGIYPFYEVLIVEFAGIVRERRLLGGWGTTCGRSWWLATAWR